MAKKNPYNSKYSSSNRSNTSKKIHTKNIYSTNKSIEYEEVPTNKKRLVTVRRNMIDDNNFYHHYLSKQLENSDVITDTEVWGATDKYGANYYRTISKNQYGKRGDKYTGYSKKDRISHMDIDKSHVPDDIKAKWEKYENAN